MNKREQLRELIALDASKSRADMFLSGGIAMLLFIASEKGWMSAAYILLIAQFATLPSLKKSWRRETIKQKYLISEEAKRRVHLRTITEFISFPLIVILMYGWVTKQVETPVFFSVMLTGGLVSTVWYKLYERHMVRLDENYVTERELKEERKWGSA